MKTHSDELFLLIKAMSPNEKFFLKVFGPKKQTDDDYSYISLFDALNQMKKYDEKQLRIKLAKSGFKNNLAKAKNYLTKAILKSLEEYHSSSSVNAEIQSLIFQTEILYKKRMITMAEKMLQKAEKLAEEYEKDEYLLIISSLKIEMAMKSLNYEEMKKFMKEGWKKEQEYLRHLINASEYRNLATEVIILDQGPEVVSTEKVNSTKLKKLLEGPLLKDSKSALTLSSKIIFHDLKFDYFLRQPKRDESTYRIYNEWVKDLEKKKSPLQKMPEVYFKALRHLLGASYLSGKRKEVEATFIKGKKIYDLLPGRNISKLVQFEFVNLLGNYSNAQLSFLSPDKTIKVFEELKDTLHIKLSAVMCSNLSISYFLLGKYREALLYVRKIGETHKDYRKDVQAMGKLFLLIVHYELRNMDLLPHIAKSSERWLVNNNFPPKGFDKRLIAFFRYKLPKMNTPEEEMNELSELLAYTKKLNRDESSILTIDFDMISWLESKIQNRPMLDILRKKYKKHK